MENRKGINPQKMALGRNFTAGLAWLNFSPMCVTRVAAQWLPSRAAWQATSLLSGAEPASIAYPGSAA
jgi:hypothetical protein